MRRKFYLNTWKCTREIYPLFPFSDFLMPLDEIKMMLILLCRYFACLLFEIYSLFSHTVCVFVKLNSYSVYIILCIELWCCDWTALWLNIQEQDFCGSFVLCPFIHSYIFERMWLLFSIVKLLDCWIELMLLSILAAGHSVDVAERSNDKESGNEQRFPHWWLSSWAWSRQEIRGWRRRRWVCCLFRGEYPLICNSGHAVVCLEPDESKILVLVLRKISETLFVCLLIGCYGCL